MFPLPAHLCTSTMLQDQRQGPRKGAESAALYWPAPGYNQIYTRTAAPSIFQLFALQTLTNAQKYIYNPSKFSVQDFWLVVSARPQKDSKSRQSCLSSQK